MQIYVITFNVTTYLFYFYNIFLKNQQKAQFDESFAMYVENNFSRNKKRTTFCLSEIKEFWTLKSMQNVGLRLICTYLLGFTTCP